MFLSEILSLEMRILHLQQQSLPVPDNIREMMVVKLEMELQLCKNMCGKTNINSTKDCLIDQIWTTTLFFQRKRATLVGYDLKTLCSLVRALISIELQGSKQLIM